MKVIPNKVDQHWLRQSSALLPEKSTPHRSAVRSVTARIHLMIKPCGVGITGGVVVSGGDPVLAVEIA